MMIMKWIKDPVWKYLNAVELKPKCWDYDNSVDQGTILGTLVQNNEYSPSKTHSSCLHFLTIDLVLIKID